MTDWYILGIKNNYAELNPEIKKFLGKVGRRKYLIPIYESLIRNEKTKTFAKRIFEENKTNYHPVSRKSLEKMFEE
jgi:hypothetical protein